MARSKLVVHTFSPGLATGWAASMPVVPPDRALVVSKIIVASRANGATTFALRINYASEALLTSFVAPLANEEAYVETSGVVVLAGFRIEHWTRLDNALIISIFGQEVDN